MKILPVLLLFLPTLVFSQITTLKVSAVHDQIDNRSYDSVENFLNKNVYQYIGQELYVNDIDNHLRNYGYTGFYIDTTIESLLKPNLYKGGLSEHKFSSIYDSLVGKYFKVLGVVKSPLDKDHEILYTGNCYLKLEERNTKTIVYFDYHHLFEHSFPFVVVGYFLKLKQTYIGNSYVMRYSKPNVKWKCVDVTIDTSYGFPVSLVLRNEKGEEKLFEVRNLKNASTPAIFDVKAADVYCKKFGLGNWQIILDGDVKIGMTKEMCELAWGDPEKINQTILSGKKSEQWVYADNNYLYFDNGVLTAIQNH